MLANQLIGNEVEVSSTREVECSTPSAKELQAECESSNVNVKTLMESASNLFQEGQPRTFVRSLSEGKRTANRPNRGNGSIQMLQLINISYQTAMKANLMERTHSKDSPYLLCSRFLLLARSLRTRISVVFEPSYLHPPDAPDLRFCTFFILAVAIRGATSYSGDHFNRLGRSEGLDTRTHPCVT